MCDHLECHGGKVKIRRRTWTIIDQVYDSQYESYTRWEASAGDWFPFASELTWQDAFEAAKSWLAGHEDIYL